MAIRFELKELTVGRGSRILKAVLTGLIDTTATPDLKHLLDLMVDSKCLGLILDCGHVDAVNSTGIAVLVGYSDRIEKAGAILVLTRPSRAVRVVVESMGFNTILNLRETETDALRLFENWTSGKPP